MPVNRDKIEVRCTDEFKQSVRVAAAKNGESMAEYFRRLAREDIGITEATADA